MQPFENEKLFSALTSFEGEATLSFAKKSL